MGLGKTIIIIGLIILALYFFAPKQYDAGKDALQSFWQNDKTQDSIDRAKDAIEERITTETTANETTSEEDTTTPTTPPPPTTDESTINEETPITQTTVCEWNNAGLPDYSGTSKEGDLCSDTILDPDWECIANTPTNYPGIINIVEKTSTPTIRCCLDDGLCRWNT